MQKGGWDQYSRWWSSVSGKDTDVCTMYILVTRDAGISGTSRAYIELSFRFRDFCLLVLKDCNKASELVFSELQLKNERTQIFACLSLGMPAERGDTEACLFRNSTSAA